MQNHCCRGRQRIAWTFLSEVGIADRPGTYGVIGMLDRIREPKLVGAPTSFVDPDPLLLDGVSRTSRRKAVLFISKCCNFADKDIEVESSCRS